MAAASGQDDLHASLVYGMCASAGSDQWTFVAFLRTEVGLIQLTPKAESLP